jgi:hypothetical protein
VALAADDLTALTALPSLKTPAVFDAFFALQKS